MSQDLFDVFVRTDETLKQVSRLVQLLWRSFLYQRFGWKGPVTAFSWFRIFTTYSAEHKSASLQFRGKKATNLFSLKTNLNKKVKFVWFTSPGLSFCLSLPPFGSGLVSFCLSSLAEALLWFWFTLLFCYIFFLLHFSCCFACNLASHTPKYPSFLTQLFHHFPPPPPPSYPSHPLPLPSPTPPTTWADSGVRSTRSMGGAAHTASKLVLSDLPPGSGQARGLSAGIHPSPDQPAAPTQCLWSQICLIGFNPHSEYTL